MQFLRRTPVSRLLRRSCNESTLLRRRIKTSWASRRNFRLSNKHNAHHRCSSLRTPYSSRLFCSSNAGSGDDDDNSQVNNTPAAMNTEEIFQFINDMDKRRKFKAVYDSVLIDPRVRIPQSEFSELCKNMSLETDESEELLTALHTAGLVWHFPRQQQVVIKPDTVGDAFLQSVDLDGEVNRSFVDDKQAELLGLLREIKPLQMQYDEIQAKAERYARRVWRGGFVYVAAHCMLVPYLTFWLLSWDIMEPVTYMFNLWTMFFGVWFYRKTHFEFTYESINNAILRLHKEKNFARIKFDIDRYEKLREQIADCEDDLMNPQWQALKAVHPGIPDTVKQVHLAPLVLLEKLEELEKQKMNAAN